MKRLQPVCLVCVLLILISCNNLKKHKTQYRFQIIKLKEPQHIIKINLVELKINEPISWLSDIETVNNKILVVSPDSTEMIKIIDPVTGTVIKSFGKKGQAPEEFIGHPSIIKDPLDEHSFWLYDLTTSKLKKYNINQVLNGRIKPIKIIGNLSFFFHLTILPDYSIAGIGYFADARIKIKKKNGEIINLGKPPVKTDHYLKQHSQGYDGNLIFSPQQKDIIITTIWGGLIERYNIEKGFKHAYLIPESSFPAYRIVKTTDGAHWTLSKDTRRGIIESKFISENNKIYMLFSGNKVVPGRYSEKESAKTIYVFDPQKNKLTEKIILSQGLDGFCILNNSGKRVIYGYADNKIFRFVL